MEFTVRKYDILREIGLTQGVVEKKNTIPILANVLIDADGDRIQISATDLELGIKCTCPAKIKKGWSDYHPGKEFFGYHSCPAR